jgi:hypothetical protein
MKDVTGLVLAVLCSAILTLSAVQLADAAEFFCPSGDVTCLIAAIIEANEMPGEHIINLEPGSYTLQMLHNGEPFRGNGLPVISGLIRVQGSAEDHPTIIERDPSAPAFRIFQVLARGELTLQSVTIQRGSSSFGAIFNQGVTSLHDSIVIDSFGADSGDGAIANTGTLRVFRSTISHNRGGPFGAGISNRPEGNVLVENSTIAHNLATAGAGIFNIDGSVIVRNSAIIFNRTDLASGGAGILNAGGSLQIVNSTIAKNLSGEFGGAGIFNSRGFSGADGQVSITNSTIRDNFARSVFTSLPRQGGGILNIDFGTVKLENTIVAGNTTCHATLSDLVLNCPGVDVSPRAQDCFGTIMSLGNNLIDDPTGCDLNFQPSDLAGDPNLDILVEEDLPGKAFYPVLANSPVIDHGNPAACPKKDQLGNPRVGTCDIGAVEFQGRRLVEVDVRPRSDANRINPTSSQNINVAIFSANGFDATTLEPNTIRFGATGTEAAPVHLGRRDVDGDGNRDLVVRFRIQDLGIQCGDTSATLSGQTSNRLAIVGSSPIRTVQCQMS